MRENGYNPPLHFFAVFTALSTFFLIVAGALVTSTGSGLAVPDWPLSYGKVMPPMVGGIFYEHGHRMVATFVGFLTVILAVWLAKKEGRRWVRMLGFAALTAVILQGLLGGLTVMFLLPTAISVSHATLAQSFFAIVCSIALFTSEWWHEQKGEPSLQRSAQSVLTLSLVTTGAIYVQLILGALMRHTHSGLAVPDFPLAYGQLLPSLSPESLSAYNQQLIYSDIRLAADGPISAGQITIHMLHRLWAIVVTSMIVLFVVRLRRVSPLPKRFQRIGFVMAGLIIVQLFLGAFTVLSHKSVDITSAHVAVGALLLIVSVLASLHLVRLVGVQFGGLRVPTLAEQVAA